MMGTDPSWQAHGCTEQVLLTSDMKKKQTRHNTYNVFNTHDGDGLHFEILREHFVKNAKHDARRTEILFQIPSASNSYLPRPYPTSAAGIQFEGGHVVFAFTCYAPITQRSPHHHHRSVIPRCYPPCTVVPQSPVLDRTVCALSGVRST